jgi:hypothetical protein
MISWRNDAMWGKRYPSIFDIFENFAKGLPFEKKEIIGCDWFREPFEDMIKRFEESVPPEFEGLVKKEKMPSGIVRIEG